MGRIHARHCSNAITYSFTHIILKIILSRYYYPHLTDEKTEVTWPSSRKQGVLDKIRSQEVRLQLPHSVERRLQNNL